MVSISIIVYAEQEKRAIYCINSIQLHTKIPYELIIIDELSDAHALDAYRMITNCRIMKWLSPLSAMEGFKLAASMAKGDYIVFMQDFIAVTSHWDRLCLNAFKQNQKLAVLTPLVNDAVGHFSAKDFQYNIYSMHLHSKDIRSDGSEVPLIVEVLDSPILIVQRDLLYTCTDFFNEFIAEETTFIRVIKQLRASKYEVGVLQNCLLINTHPFIEESNERIKARCESARLQLTDNLMK